ncbi:GH36-type glycosyl hydrolase domain-containing protein [Tichowtungia aerotolerans]|uniref:Glycosyl transferase n=1 Tax=Tichowtungia aerotolerans TaxID=2697043 RepID=A0A6P1MDL1_9BACT|nr:glycosyl transferase [Tichowtungia aerotolerans]QHI70654.1 glycosyl transferase [Tichowtungia aerotolerans]
MKYGYFDVKNREYVIERPDTPLPWINYLGKEGFYSLISNTAGGYSFYVDARKRRLTRYRYNNIPNDVGGRYLYLRDNKTEEIWSSSWAPVKATLDLYECRHGLGYTVIQSQKNGIDVTVRYFVPLDINAEVWEVSVKNISNEAKDISVFSFVEWCLWEALNDMTNYQSTYNYGEVEVEGNIIYHKTEYRERRNHFAYFGCSEDVAAYETDGHVFWGMHSGFDSPESVRLGQLKNTIAEGWNPIGSHQLNLMLQPSESKEINFALGYWENPQDQKFSAPQVVNKSLVEPVIEKLLNRKKTEALFAERVNDWENALNVLQVETPDEEINTMVNTWTPYQCVQTYIHARSTSFWDTGIGRGIGYRDAAQDIMAAVHLMDPPRIRQRVIDLAGIQWRTGATYHQFQPLTKKGNAEIGTGFNDDPLWLLIATAAYVKETGDWSILDEMIPYADDHGAPASLYDHMLTSFNYSQKYRGPNGLPLIGRADWNDCLNLLITRIEEGENWQGEADYAALDTEVGSVPESLMISGQFVIAVNELAAMAAKRGDMETVEKARAAVAQMKQNIINNGWDGEWFVRAYDRHGKAIGSKDSPEGASKICIESQVWNVWAEVGFENGCAKQAMDSVKDKLYCEHGILLNQPSYTVFNVEHGQMTTVPPGLKENGSVFCQPNGWAISAECKLGRGDRALEYYNAICPIKRENLSEVHRAEPYIYSQMIAGPESAYCGEARNSWLTGSAASNLAGMTQGILGVQADYDGLKIDPCLPTGWKACKISRYFRGDIYNIEIHNPDGLGTGITHITVNGVVLEGNVMPVIGDGTVHDVQVIITKD